MPASIFELNHELDRGTRLPVYFLYGEERFLQTEFVNKLRDRLITPENRNFNLEIFDGKSSQVGDWLGSVRMISFLGGDKLVIVNGLDEAKLSDGEIKDLLAYASQPIEDSCLVLLARKADRKRKLYKELTKLKGAGECDAPKENLLRPWLQERAKQAGKSLAPDAAQALLNRVGPRPGLLAGELDKVVTYTGNAQSIKGTDVAEVVGDIKMEKVFALTDALKAKDSAQAVRMLRNQLDHGEEPIKVLGMIAWQFRLIWEVKHHQERRLNKQQIVQAMGASPFLVDQAMRYTRNFKRDQLRIGFRELMTADRRLKSTGQPAEGVLEALVLKLCSAGS